MKKDDISVFAGSLSQMQAFAERDCSHFSGNESFFMDIGKPFSQYFAYS
jgi:hypothetical protein